MALLKLPFQLNVIQAELQRDFYAELVFDAISNISDEIYDDLLWFFWSERGRLTNEGFIRLSKANPEKVFDLIRKSLSASGQFYKANTSPYKYSSAKYARETSALLSSMLELALKKDNNFALTIIKNNLDKPIPAVYPIFTKAISETQNNMFHEQLLQLLENENRKIVENTIYALLSFDDATINQEIALSLVKNRSLREGYYWDRLYKKVKENKAFLNQSDFK